MKADAFERWATKEGFCCERNGSGMYYYSETRNALRVWKAALDAAAREVAFAGEQVASVILALKGERS